MSYISNCYTTLHPSLQESSFSVSEFSTDSPSSSSLPNASISLISSTIPNFLKGLLHSLLMYFFIVGYIISFSLKIRVTCITISDSSIFDYLWSLDAETERLDNACEDGCEDDEKKG